MAEVEPFIVRPGDSRRRAPWCRYVTCSDLRVTHPEHTRVVRHIGPFREVEGTGRFDHSRLTIRPTGSIHTASGTPRTDGSRDAGWGPTTAAGVKGIVRMLRPEEGLELAVLDTAIEETEQALAALRDERADLVAKAWTKGHVVRLNEIKEQAVEARY